ncbi:MAG: protein-L-isoaspartate(D-aspartate) O-methyltransferase [Breznakibacter sp.]|nr:protein-L-isoaspartate(D-aspartate) O-methyltransferase [Breznakibacter sp.]
MNLLDTYRHKGLRLRLVAELRAKGIRDERVLEAINRVPRHLFLESSFVNFAYQDKAFPIAAGQTISQPYTVAFQTQTLGVEKGEKVLEVGTGSGFQAAVLMEMGASLFSIERQQALFQRTIPFLQSLGYRGRFFFGDGYQGLPEWAPFDKIIVTAGAPYVPEALLVQLKIDGVMVIPVGDDVQNMIKIVRLSDDEFEQVDLGACAFVPMLEGVNK